MYKKIDSKKTGSALLMALIFAFVIMVMLTGLLYTFKMGLLTTKSIIKNSNDKVLGETYISKVQDDIDFTKSSEFKIGDSKFEVTVDDEDISEFFPKNTNAELFQSQEYSSYNAIYKAFNLGTNVNLTERIIYNALTANTYQNFDGDYTPINVPMINPDAMTDYQERIYRLESDGTMSKDAPKGFIGLIQKQNKQLSIFTQKAKIGVPIPDAMGTGYKVKVGWNLEKGKWSIYLLLYDTDKLFTTSFPLEDILADDVEGLAEDNEALGNEIGKWQAVVSGGGRGMSSSGEQFTKDGIIDVAWYFENSDGPPQLMLVRNSNENQSSSRSNSDAKKKGSKSKKKKISRTELEVYYSEYSTSNNNYALKLAEKMPFKTELSESSVKLLVPDVASNLEANMVLIFHPNNQSKTIMGISDFNYNGDHRVGKSLDTYIDGESFGKPVIVSKSNDSMYIITYESDKLHRYEYKKGMGSFESLEYGSNGLEKEFEFEKSDENVVVGLPDSQQDDESEDDDGIQLVVPKFGYLFVFTSDKVMQLNYEFDVLQEVDIDATSSPQILADFDSVKNTINKIYIQPEALDLKAQDIKDELGDEDEPEDESEVDDKSSSSSQTRERPKSTAERKREELAKNNKNGEDEEEDDEPAEPVYLDSKYLYPLGVVKKVII
ncbi:membrane protein [Candidatus Francisella endociliophora]|uniref:Membrane protein n=1 Tax=Candidatus Francisella endociliophora TaxID=653937 RepID=A0A097EQU9_9GAMM|nr:hypothetical protein [Francisella sp. FSC1006]AIT09936.1 membrane protein [Francisella sp. FSC1006]